MIKYKHENKMQKLSILIITVCNIAGVYSVHRFRESFRQYQLGKTI